MKIALIGSRNLFPEESTLKKHFSDTDEIISGGAAGVDTCAANYAKKHKMKLTVFLPKYNLYGKAAPIIRNKEIVDHADKIIVFGTEDQREVSL